MKKGNEKMIDCDMCKDWMCLKCSGCKNKNEINNIVGCTKTPGVKWLCTTCREVIDNPIRENPEDLQLELDIINEANRELRREVERDRRELRLAQEELKRKEIEEREMMEKEESMRREYDREEREKDDRIKELEAEGERMDREIAEMKNRISKYNRGGEREERKSRDR